MTPTQASENLRIKFHERGWRKNAIGVQFSRGFILNISINEDH